MAVLDVLVFDDKESAHADLVESALAAAGASVGRLNCSTLDGGLVQASPGAWQFGQGDALWEVTASSTIWYRRRGSVRVDGLENDEADLARDELPHVLLGGLLGTGARWVDDPFTVERAEQKLLQMATATRLGLTLPPSLVTNAPTAAATLAEAGRVIAKPLSPGEGIVPFVDEVSADDLKLVSALPVLVQQLVVEANADLRVLVVGSSGWVWRRPRADGTVDWRAVDPSGAEFVLIEDEELVRDAVHLTMALGLTMSVQDWLEVPGRTHVFLEANPQGAWAFLPGADGLVPGVLAKYLAPGPSGGIALDGVWPKPLRRIAWDLGRAERAPANDGVTAPEVIPPTWIALATRAPEALAVAQRANDEAKAGAKAAEDKAARLAQTALATVAVATAIGGFQVGFALEHSTWLILMILPVAAAVVCLATAAFEAVEIDRVGFYDNATAEDLAVVGARSPIVGAVVREEVGRQLARWTSRKKHTSLMQARAWFSRGLFLLLLASIVAAVSWGVRVSERGHTRGTDSPPSSATSTSTPSGSTAVPTTHPAPATTRGPGSSPTTARPQPTTTTGDPDPYRMAIDQGVRKMSVGGPSTLAD